MRHSFHKPLIQVACIAKTASDVVSSHLYDVKDWYAIEHLDVEEYLMLSSLVDVDCHLHP